MLSKRTWYVPKRMQISFDAELSGDHELAGVRQDAGNPPVAAFRKVWRATDTLKVNASFSRPSEASKNERRIFFAGVLISLQSLAQRGDKPLNSRSLAAQRLHLRCGCHSIRRGSVAASFFVWALELLFGPERNPVAALRRRP